LALSGWRRRRADGLPEPAGVVGHASGLAVELEIGEDLFEGPRRRRVF
jgi:hypothetical protein